MRRREMLNLKLADLNFDRREVHVRAPKGRKDRILDISGIAYEALTEYMKKHKLTDYLFEGATGGRYSCSSLVNVVKRGAKNAGIHKRVYPHLLRHSFATHLIEQGVDISKVQEILGHVDVKTTQRYTHISRNEIRKIENPLDRLRKSSGKTPKKPP
jgi:site-specific recombinase XerD